MRKYLRSTLAALLAVLTALAFPAATQASPVDEARGGANAAGSASGPGFNDVVLTVTNILVFIVGVAAVIMIILGAIKYVTANGDEKAITSAKNTIIYSIVGLILAIAAGGIVNWVLQQFAALPL